MSGGLTEQAFRLKSDLALEETLRALLPLADREGFEVELANGVLNIVFETPRPERFVVSPNAPVRQVWVSAMAQSYKLSWVAERQVFASEGEALPALVARLAAAFLGRD
jgi:iron-sulfur cluster assembly protein CyaY